MKVSLLCVAAVFAVVACARIKGGEEVNIRGNEDFELNCPNIPGPPFEPGTTLCEGCKAVTDRIRYLATNKGMDIYDIEPPLVCQWMQDHAELHQKKNGFRWWHVSNSEEETHSRQKEGLDKEDAVNFHTKYENERLPCASFLLKRYCEKWWEKREHDLELCLGRFKKELGQSGMKTANSTLQECFHLVCRQAECDPKVLKTAKQKERIAFMKYEAAFGKAGFNYVADEEKEGLLIRNPYAKGGDKVHENEYLAGDSEL